MSDLVERSIMMLQDHVELDLNLDEEKVSLGLLSSIEREIVPIVSHWSGLCFLLADLLQL